MIPQQRPLGSDSGEAGFGLIEIVISMFLLGLLAIAFLPLLITSMQTTVRNSTIATATQLVNQQMEEARVAGDTCAALTAYGDASVALPTTTDARGVSYQPTREVAPCTLETVYPRTVSVTVLVSMVASTVAPVTATTLVYLRAPS